MAAFDIEMLRSHRHVTDEAFDRVFPAWARRPTATHWTPVAVARRAAELLVERPGARVLDVGSGAGKFCLVGALTTPGVFTGVEQRAHLVRMARDVARSHRIARVRFIAGDAFDLDWSSFDAFYLYNPFEEHRASFRRPIDRTIELAPIWYARHALAVEARLARASAGTRVVTYHGFGGRMPAGWLRQRQERWGSGVLELWVRA